MQLRDIILNTCKEHYPEEKDYVLTHLERYVKTFEYIQDYIKPDHKVLVLGDNTAGSTFTRVIKDNFANNVTVYSNDLRYPIVLKSKSYDFVFCTEVIEHIKDENSDRIEDLEVQNWSGLNNLLKEIKRLKKNDGYCIITTPNQTSLDVIIHAILGNPPYHFYPHPREFSVYEILGILHTYNYKVLHCNTYNTWSSPHPTLLLEKIGKLVKQFRTKYLEQNIFLLIQ